jgi:hypothetical protein
MPTYIYFNGFWSGFLERTNPTNVKFFLELFESVYNTPVAFGSLDESTILVENTQVQHTVRDIKAWTHTYLFSGESYLHNDHSKYTCVLFGRRNHKNFVNVPLYIPYLASSFDESVIKKNKASELQTMPQKDALVIVSNPNGAMRNRFCEELEKHMNVTYAGGYKNNIGGSLSYSYNSKEFLDYVGQYKFIISMENSDEETYITEKIIHGLLGGSIPVYWGSKHVLDYFNKDRILTVDGPNDIETVIHTMKTMTEQTWLKKVNTQPFTELGRQYDIQAIAKYVKNVVFQRTFPLLDHVYFICNEVYEPERYKRLQQLCNTTGLKEHNVTFLCPTYKQTITDAMYKEYVKTDLVLRLRPIPMKRAELSLFFNFRAVLEHATMHFRDAMILTLESDVFTKSNYLGLNACLDSLRSKDWDCVHIGGSMISAPFCNSITPYRYLPDRLFLLSNADEDLSSIHDDLRYARRFHTRCTDSLLWQSRGVDAFLKHMNEDLNYGAPFDYYFTNKLENDMSFKHYWSYTSYFDQRSNEGLEQSTIQSDTS